MEVPVLPRVGVALEGGSGGPAGGRGLLPQPGRAGRSPSIVWASNRIVRSSRTMV